MSDYIEVVKTELSDVILFNRRTKEVFVIPLAILDKVIDEMNVIQIQRDADIANPDKKAGIDYV